jgi:hypothetical protein
MALTFSNYSTFAEVVAHYNNIAPVRGRGNVGKDIRPIGDRSRKYERIVKISANCYALTFGFTFGDSVYPDYGYVLYNVPAVNKTLEKYAPVVWRRLRDGTDQVTIRNGWGPGVHEAHNAFLSRHTPAYMLFTTQAGTQRLTVRDVGQYQGNGPTTTHYLAKVRTTPRRVYEAYQVKPSSNWMSKIVKFIRLRDDNSAVVFRRKDNSEWQHVEGTGLQEPRKPYVDKEAKAKFKDDINKFFEWGMAVSPLLPLEDEDYRRAREAELHILTFSQSHIGRASMARAIVRDGGHDLRLAFWVVFAGNCTDQTWGLNTEYYTKTVQTKQDLSLVRVRFNTFINNQLGFVKGGNK